MNTEEFLKRRKSYVDKLKATESDLSGKLTLDFMRWQDENLPYKVGKVYELVENGIRRRGFKRFVIYSFHPSFFNFDKNNPTFMCRCGGWWLDENDIPAKWDNMVVYGAGNNAVFELSKRQRNLSVPKHLGGHGYSKKAKKEKQRI